MSNDHGSKKKIARIEVDYIADGSFYTGFTEYIGEDRLFIVTTEVTEPGNIIFIDMYLPNYRHKLKLKGRVLKSYEYSVDDTPPGMEVEYLELREYQRKVITEFIERIHSEEER